VKAKSMLKLWAIFYIAKKKDENFLGNNNRVVLHGFLSMRICNWFLHATCRLLL